MLVNGVLFGLVLFGNHPSDVLLMLLDDVAVSAVYGGLTWAADSILPAVVLHSTGDMIVLTRWWATGRPEWQLTATPPPLVWEHGLDVPLGTRDHTRGRACCLDRRDGIRAGVSPADADFFSRARD